MSSSLQGDAYVGQDCTQDESKAGNDHDDAPNPALFAGKHMFEILYRKMRNTRRITKSRWMIWLAGGTFLSLIAGVVAVVAVFAYFAKDLPNPDRVVRREGFATKIYDRKDRLLYDVFSDQRRTPVDFSQMPLVLRQATISIEDKNFYKHQGFDLLGLVRALVLRPLLTGRFEGASTLTQQLVKNTLLTSQRSVTRKLKEFILTLQVERKYSKDQILQMYLNEAPYGGTAWGVEAASETYFGKPVAQVNLPEAAILAGLPQSPSAYSPLVGKLYLDRAVSVLRRMREDGYITSIQEQEAKKALPEVSISTQSGLLKAPHFVFYVRNMLIQRYGERTVEQGGLKVTTSLDLDLQEVAQKTVSEEIDKVKYLNITNGASVVINPENGQILAMVGSRGWDDEKYDGKYNVTLAKRQPGSSIKPVVYLTGLRKGYTAATMLMDVKTVFPGGDKPEYVPENYDGKFHGPMLLRDALGNSINVPAVKLLAMVGINDSLKIAYDMGFTTLEPTPDLLKRVGLSMALGGGEVRLLDMVSAYSAFANGGKRVEPVAILKVTDASGKVLEEWKQGSGRQVVTPEEAYIISSMLADPAARTITFGPRSAITVAGKTISVKTGTTNDKKDNWTVGWTPSVIAGVWVGNNDNKPMKEVASGITGAAPIWKKIISFALKDKQDEQIATPSGIVAMDIDKISGWASHDGFESRKEFFVRGTEPAGEDPVHKKIKVCKGEGKLATPADIASGNFEEKEALYFKEEDPFEAYNKSNKWQEGILNWLKDQQDPKYHPPTDMCGNTNPLWITIKDPGEHGRINSNDVKIVVEVTSTANVNKVEFYVDGVLKQTLNSSPWELTVNVSDGNHKVDIKAWDEQGHDGSRYVEFGVNKDWQSP